jgi:RNA polymerase sigma-70 factor (ECF subfamily)
MQVVDARLRDIEARVRERLGAADPGAAATAAIQAFGPGVLRYLRSLLRDEEDAADAFSLFTERLWRGLPAFRWDAALRTWAYQIACNAATNLRDEAWRRRRRRLESGAAAALAQSIRSRSFVRAARRHDALEQLRAALTPEERSLLALRVDQEFSFEEIAAILSGADGPVRANTVMKRFERLKTKLAMLARARGMME